MAKEAGLPETPDDLSFEEAVPEQEESERLSQQRDERDAEWDKAERERHAVEIMRRVHQKRSFPFQ